MTPTPLTESTILVDRFEIVRPLGSGGFAIAYLAVDLVRGKELVVLKELAPDGTRRLEDQSIDIDALGADGARLRSQFLKEYNLLTKINHLALPRIRTTFTENNTAYFVSEFVPDAKTLQDAIQENGTIAPEKLTSILTDIALALQYIHSKGILHRDIKPSNILLGKNNKAYLIDFGAARTWHTDKNTQTQTIIFTPGYAPIEMMSPRARRGPATDIYGLAATAYAALTGNHPYPVTERLNGQSLPPILIPPQHKKLVDAINAGLSIPFENRPQSIDDFLLLLKYGSKMESIPTVEDLDERACILKKLNPGRAECPSCHHLLKKVVPLASMTCPVCTEGRIEKRTIQKNRCPSCKSGILHKHETETKPFICPLCTVTPLQVTSQSFFRKNGHASCKKCLAAFQQNSDIWTLTEHKNLVPQKLNVEVGESMPWSEWQKLSGRSRLILLCDGCGAQYDEDSDGRLLQTVPKPKPDEHNRLYPEEWARVAAHYDPGCGTHICGHCRADYYVEGSWVTLLDATEDPFLFSEAFLGQPLQKEDLRWLGAGKDSMAPGQLCTFCRTEFDSVQSELKLIRTTHPVLSEHIGLQASLPNWHRIANQLPMIGFESELKMDISRAIVASFESGEAYFDGKSLVWKGSVTLLDDKGSKTTLIIKDEEIIFGGILKKQKIPMEEVSHVSCEGDELSIWLKNGEYNPQTVLNPPSSFDEVAMVVEPQIITLNLKSGQQSVQLEAQNLAVRIDTILNG